MRSTYIQTYGVHRIEERPEILCSQVGDVGCAGRLEAEEAGGESDSFLFGDRFLIPQGFPRTSEILQVEIVQEVHLGLFVINQISLLSILTII